MPEWLASHDMWNSIFVLGAPLVEKILRPVVVYFFLVVVLRVFGKRELAQLNPFDLVVLLSLSNTVQNAIIGNDNSLTGGVIGAFALLAMNYLVVRFLFRHRRLDQVFEGKPTMLIEHGKIVKHSLAQRAADAVGADDGVAPAGVRHAGGGRQVRARAGRNVLHPAERAAPQDTGGHDETMQALKELTGKAATCCSRGQGGGRRTAIIIRTAEEWVSG